MSLEAITATLRVQVKPASHKFVLFVYANFADEGLESYPSIKALAEITSLDRKTIILAIRDLLDQGYLIDTGKKTGATKKIPIYRINPTPAKRKQSQKRNRSKTGTVPKTEQFQNSQETVPKTVPETVPKTVLGYKKDTKGTRGRLCTAPDGAVAPPASQVSQQHREPHPRQAAKGIAHFHLTPALRQWAAEKCPTVPVDDETEAFLDWARSKGVRRHDWAGTWRNWMRKAVRDYPAARASPHQASSAMPCPHRQAVPLSHDRMACTKCEATFSTEEWETRKHADLPRQTP